jgi:microcin C transport system permease protein
MATYLIRRLLLMIPTILGITLICFFLIQILPGGPVEQALGKIKAAAAQSSISGNGVIDLEEIANIKAYYGFDKPIYERYFIWIGKVFTLDLGMSNYDEPVWDVISARFPISLFFGLTSFLLTYLICIPLGVIKALKNHSQFDTLSSVLVFSGYVIPGYALGIILLILFGGGTWLDWFPLGGIVSDNFEYLSFWGKTLDFLHHMVLPMICYMLPEFAFLTFLMKNTLLEELNKDYVRMAQLKGHSPRSAAFKHALRNALVPLATRMSEIFTLMFAGALLIEKVFDIDGMGLLYYNAMVSRDYNVVMGVILLSSVMALLGRLFADILYTKVDPRINMRAN